jgi:hypothetical protein
LPGTCSVGAYIQRQDIIKSSKRTAFGLKYKLLSLSDLVDKICPYTINHSKGKVCPEILKNLKIFLRKH